MIPSRPDDVDPERAPPRKRTARSIRPTKAAHTQPDTGRPRLSECEDRLRAIDQAMFTLDNHGQVTSWNAGAERILGWPEATILGLDSAVLYPPAEGDAGGSAAEMQAAAAAGHVDSERWMLRRDGTQLWAAQTLTPLLGEDGERRGFLKLLRDRTGPHVAEMALARSEAQLRRRNEALEAEVVRNAAERGRAWQHNPDLQMVARADATLVAVNPAWSALLGWTEDELVGPFALDLVHPDDRAVTLAEMERLAAGLPVLRFLNRYQHRDGTARYG